MNNWTEQIDQITHEFQELTGDLSVEQLNWKPATDQWSIAQNIDHLITINSSYFPVLAKLHSGEYRPPFISKFGFAVSFLGKMILNSVDPSRRRKMKTFTIWEPSQSHLPEDILQQFVNHQSKLKQEIDSSTSLVAQGAVIASPANKFIVYKLSAAFDIIVTHERRHLEQMKEVQQLWEKNTKRSAPLQQNY